MYYRELVLDNSSLIIRNVDGEEPPPPAVDECGGGSSGSASTPEINSVKIEVDSVKKWYALTIEWLLLSEKKRVKGRWTILDEDGVFRNGAFEHDMRGVAKPGSKLKLDEKYAERNIPKVLSFGGRNSLVDDAQSRRYCAASLLSIELFITKNNIKKEGQQNEAFMSQTMCRTFLKETLCL